MSNLNKNKILILLTMVAAASMLSGIVLTSFAEDTGEENDTCPSEWIKNRMMLGTPRGFPGGFRGRGGCGFMEVSEEFEQNVIDIAENDLDVQDLLNDGYNITRVRPIIKSVVGADGDVETKATSAIVILKNETGSHASAWVDIEAGKVTKIVILTRTVIDKA